MKSILIELSYNTWLEVPDSLSNEALVALLEARKWKKTDYGWEELENATTIRVVTLPEVVE